MTNEELILSLSCTFLIGGILLFVFLFMYFKPPQYSNPVYGYRTGLSQKNEKYWRFSNDLFMKCLGWSIFIFTLISASKTILFADYFPIFLDTVLTCMLLPFIYIPMMIYIESRLHKMDKEEKINIDTKI